MAAIVEAEEAGDDAKGKTLEITADDLERVELEGAIDPAHLRPFLLWHMTSEMPNGIGLMEAYSMPEEYATDVIYFLSIMRKEREKIKRRKDRANTNRKPTKRR